MSIFNVKSGICSISTKELQMKQKNLLEKIQVITEKKQKDF